MTKTARSIDVPYDRAARLSVVHRGELDPAAACRALETPNWLGTPVDNQGSGRQRFLTDLALPLTQGSRTLVFRKAAYVDVGSVIAGASGCEVEIDWSSASLAPLFPVFAGLLNVSSSGLALNGVYAPPLGGVGLLIDAALLRFVAHRTAHWFLKQLAAELTSL